MIDPKYMDMAIKLAAKGGKSVRPNPMVGAIIVKDDVIVGEGYHTRYGAPHAEREALSNAGKNARGATMYVTLEPCNHHGKTPPCTEAIIESGIENVVIGIPDPNPDVAGRGMKWLEGMGISCRIGVLEAECREQNEVFLVNILEKRPFIQVKLAQTLDGFIAPEDGYSKWITGEDARVQSHRLRAESDAIIVGFGTLNQDNPALTVRHIIGEQPRRVLLTDTLNLPLDSTMLSDDFRESSLVLYTESTPHNPKVIGTLKERGISVIPIATDSYGKADIFEVMRILWEKGVYKLMIEGGAGVYSSFMQSGTVDRVDAFIAPKIFGSGVSVFQYIQARSVESGVQFTLSDVSRLGNDIYAIMRRG